MKQTRRLAVVLVGVLACPVAADWHADVGYDDLVSRLQGASQPVPDGSGIDVSQVEAPLSGNYAPNTADGEFVGKTFTLKSGASGSSSHATYVGREIYGTSSSITPQITTIDVYDVNDYVGSGMLRYSTVQAPKTESRRIENHSWAGSAGTVAGNTDVLRRFDLLLDRDGVVATVGVANDTGSPPELMSNAYNAIAVGLTGGTSSRGPTVVDTAGRCKPDIVGPSTVGPSAATSWTTGAVASGCALLIQQAEWDNILSGLTGNARRRGIAIVTKATLMAGATKDEFADWRKGFTTPSTDGTVPLDYRYGAGEMNIDNSHWILTAGQQPASDVSNVTEVGWDFDAASTSSPRRYFFETDPFKRIEMLSVMVVWNREITTSGGNPLGLNASLADIDLALKDASGYTPGATVDESISSLDNVEHIYQENMSGGRYVLEVSTDQAWDYAIAWNTRVAPYVSPDIDQDTDVDVSDFAAFQLCFSGPGVAPPNSGCAAADFDGDDDVDVSDFATFQLCFAGPGQMPACGD